ncbi:MAG TPA: hypothetical protein VF516_01500 [Kofleriaceae bacterium]
MSQTDTEGPDDVAIEKPAKPTRKAADDDRKGPARKKATKPSKRTTKGAGSRGPQSKRPQHEFPVVSLEVALKIPQKIKEINQGNPWDSNDVAKASVNTTKTNNKFFYTATASRDYGLTVGGRDSDKVSLEELGQDIVYATTPETKHLSKLRAFFNIPLFEKVFTFTKEIISPGQDDDQSLCGDAFLGKTR